MPIFATLNLQLYSRFNFFIMKQVFFIVSLAALFVACKGGASGANAKADLAGKYKMEMVLSEKELAENPQAKSMMDMMKLECDMTADGKCYVTAEMMGQSKKDTSEWDVNGDSLILMSKGKREAAKMVKVDGGFTITQETGKMGSLTLKYTKQK